MLECSLKHSMIIASDNVPLCSDIRLYPRIGSEEVEIRNKVKYLGGHIVKKLK